MANGCCKTFISRGHGQSMVEFALILPLFVLFIVGIFELGRAFFAFIAISNAAREGARVVTFWPGKTAIADVNTAVIDEVGTSPMVREDKIDSIQIECVLPPYPAPTLTTVTTDTALKDCSTMQSVRVTVTYQFDLILNFFSAGPLMLRRSVEMMV
jgi:Flp pilus assembly protein TadG